MKTTIAIAMSAVALVVAPAMAQQAPPLGQDGGQPPQAQPGRDLTEGRMAGPPPLPLQEGQGAGQPPQSGADCPQADRDRSGRCVPRPR